MNPMCKRCLGSGFASMLALDPEPCPRCAGTGWEPDDDRIAATRAAFERETGKPPTPRELGQRVIGGGE